MLTQIRDYVSAHPYLVSAILYPLLTALISGIFHARSEGEYANKPARVAALYKLVAAVGVDVEKAVRAVADVAFGPNPAARAKGLASLVAALTIDPPKLLEALYQLITGTRREDEPKPPTGGAAMLVLVAMVLGVGCHESPACSPESLALIESAYVAEAIETCRGRSVSECGELDGIKAKYRAKREEWVSCR